MKVLVDVGERGISVRYLARHVYNMSNSLFATSDIKEVHQSVRQYLLRQSRSSKGIIEGTGQWGCYRLRRQYLDQLRLNFMDEEPVIEQKPVSSGPDLSLSLFDDF